MRYLLQEYDEKMLEYLLEKKADINYKNKFNNTALHIALYLNKMY